MGFPARMEISGSNHIPVEMLGLSLPSIVFPVTLKLAVSALPKGSPHLPGRKQTNAKYPSGYHLAGGRRTGSRRNGLRSSEMPPASFYRFSGRRGWRKARPRSSRSGGRKESPQREGEPAQGTQLKSNRARTRAQGLSVHLLGLPTPECRNLLCILLEKPDAQCFMHRGLTYQVSFRPSPLLVEGGEKHSSALSC